MIRSAFFCALLLAYAWPTWSADKPASKAAVKPAAKAAPKKTPKRTAKAAPKTVKASYKPPARPTRVLLGKTETLTCREGTEDRHARIGVVVIGGKVDNFAYYSKWKPRTCSIYLQRNRDGYSRWTDKGSVTNVNLDRGWFLIEHGKGEYRFVFRDIDRERFCGMDGTINGVLTIRKGSERCELTGIMEEGVPLGQAYAQVGETPPAAAPAASPASAPVTPPSRQASWWNRNPSETAFPSAASGISD